MSMTALITTALRNGGSDVSFHLFFCKRNGLFGYSGRKTIKLRQQFIFLQFHEVQECVVGDQRRLRTAAARQHIRGAFLCNLIEDRAKASL